MVYNSITRLTSLDSLIKLCIFHISSAREKCPNTEFFLIRIWTLFTQCITQSLFIEADSFLELLYGSFSMLFTLGNESFDWFNWSSFFEISSSVMMTEAANYLDNSVGFCDVSKKKSYYFKYVPPFKKKSNCLWDLIGIIYLVHKQHFPKNQHFLLPDTQTYVYQSWGKNVSFLENFSYVLNEWPLIGRTDIQIPSISREFIFRRNFLLRKWKVRQFIENERNIRSNSRSTRSVLKFFLFCNEAKGGSKKF